MNDILVIGVDTSSKKLAVCIAPFDEPAALVMQVYRLAERDRDKGVMQAYDTIDELLTRYHKRGMDIRLFVEYPISWRSGTSTIALARINGAITVAAGHHGVKHNAVNNQAWKAALLGRHQGRVDKTKIAHGVQRVWPLAFDRADGDQDLLDSAGVCFYGRRVVQKAEGMRARGTTTIQRRRVRV